LTTLLIGGYGAYTHIHHSSEATNLKASYLFQVPLSETESIPRIAWSSSPNFLAEIVSARRPVILYDSDSSRRWNSLQLWKNLTYLVDKLESKNIELKNVKNFSTPVFLLGRTSSSHPSSPSSSTSPSSVPEIHMREKLSMREFVEAASDPSQYLYYSGPIEWWGSDLDQQVRPRRWMEIQEDILGPRTTFMEEKGKNRDNAGETESDSVAVVWMAHPGIIAQTHYDQSHNLHTSILGRKRFLLFPPEEWKSMYLFPNLSPHKRQSQVPIDVRVKMLNNEGEEEADNRKEEAGGIETVFPEFFEPDVKALEAVLEPGETLFLPPFWFHTVQSLDFCISLSVISPSREEVVYNQAFWKPTPWTNLLEATSREKAASVAEYIRLLFSPAPSSSSSTPTSSSAASEDHNEDAARFVKEVLVYGRYKTYLFGEDQEGVFERWRGMVKEEAKRTGVCQLLPSSGSDSGTRRKELTDLLEQMKPLAVEVGRTMSCLSGPIRDIYLGNFVEELTKWAMGNERQVGAFLTACFT
jgi:hypothetical protein